MRVGKLRKKIKQLTVNHLDLPSDLILNMPRISVIGFNQIYIENFESVVQFNDKFLHIRVNRKEVKIVGEKLVIRQIWPDEIFIEGVIKEIHHL